MSVKAWTYLFVGLTFGFYLTIAWLSRVKDTKGFYVAGQGVPASANGMATAADWMSAASFISMAGLISFTGFAGGAYLLGWTGGYVLLALLLAPYLRKFGRFTVPDFIGDRYPTRGNVARLVAVICAIFISFTYVAGQMRGVGVVFSRFLEVDVTVGVVIGMAIVFIYATLGGMKGITWTQVAQYWVLITAFLIPAIAISIKLTGVPVPQIGLGSKLVESAGGATGDGGIYQLDKLNLIHKDLGFGSYTEAYGEKAKWSKFNMFLVVTALMVGTAGLPHVIIRFYTVRTVRAARWSAFWALLFISGLYLTAPSIAAFARYYMIDSLNGKTAETMPKWYESWSDTGLVIWLDDGDGVVEYRADADNEIFRQGKIPTAEYGQLRADHQLWLDSEGEEGTDGRVTLTDKKSVGPDADIMVLATPEMAELSNWMIAFIAAGGLAAALSTASGLLLVISSAIAHDLYARTINPEASEAARLRVGRATIGVAVVIAGLFGIYPPGFVSEVVAFAFGLAAASFFPAIVLGIFSKRVGSVPAIAGMVSGLGFTAFYIVATIYGGMDRWTLGIEPKGIDPQGIGTVGMVINFAVTFALTYAFPGPPDDVKELIDSVREPEDETAAVAIETAPAH